MKKNSIGRAVSLGIVLAIILSFVTPPGFAASEKKTDLQILGSQTAVNARKDFLLQIKMPQREHQIWSFTSTQL